MIPEVWATAARGRSESYVLIRASHCRITFVYEYVPAFVIEKRTLECGAAMLEAIDLVSVSTSALSPLLFDQYLLA